MGYGTLLEASGILHSKTGLLIKNDTYTNGYFIFLFDITIYSGASEGHTSHPAKGNIRTELKFTKPLPAAITCLLYLEFDNSAVIDFAGNVTTAF